MKQNVVEISFTGNNFSAHLPALPGCVSTGSTPGEVKQYIQEAIVLHLAGMKEDGDRIPKSFSGAYELVYNFDIPSLINYFKGILTNSAWERLTGINQKQMQHYATGHRKPRPAQRAKIITALHSFGKELLSVEL